MAVFKYCKVTVVGVALNIVAKLAVHYQGAERLAVCHVEEVCIDCADDFGVLAVLWHILHGSFGLSRLISDSLHTPGFTLIVFISCDYVNTRVGHINFHDVAHILLSELLVVNNNVSLFDAGGYTILCLG